MAVDDGQRARGNGVTVRRAMLADALADDGTEPMDVAEPEPGGYVTPAAPPPDPPAPSADMQSLIAALVSGITQGSAGTADAIKAALSDAAVLAREPIPENKVATGVSVYSHPLGDKVHPRTKLRCPMYLGVYDEKGQTIPAFEIHEDTSTERERVLLNSLRHGSVRVERNDGMQALCQVSEQRDDLGQPIRVVVAVPQTWLAKDQQAQMPGLVTLLTQLSAA